jgi:fructoselysine 6-kinase
MNTKAVSLGDCCIDHYLPPIDREFIGGNALNVAIHIGRAGLPAAFVGAVSGDRYGQIILQALRQQNVDTSHVQHTASPSRRAKIQLTNENEHIFIHEGHIPTPRLELDDRALSFIKQHQLVHSGWLGGAQGYLPAIKQAIQCLSLDYGEGQDTTFLEKTRSLADLAFFSMPLGTEEQARSRAEEMGRWGAEVVVVTRGRGGSLAFCNGEFYSQPAYPVQVVDSLGAGDAFIGTFLAGWLLDLSTKDCLERASGAAAFTCTHYGGWTGAEVI